MSVQVAVRSRPLNREELDCGASIIVRMNQGQVEVMDSSQGRGQKFSFDHAFWSSNAVVPGNKNTFATQETVFGALGKEALFHTFDGYNACIFAYGQTGSGKTYSMMGAPSDEGLIPRIACSLFDDVASKQQNGVEVCVEVSYLEIYNERVRCLLDPVVDTSAQEGHADLHPLRVREHPVHGPYVEGLAKLVVTNKDDFLRLMADGNRIRTTGATSMNAQSSRSHAVFTVTVTQKALKGSTMRTTKSKMNLVDLAGSERAAKTHASGARLVEGSNINKSLSALGLVISGLAEEFESGKQRHIPYRDSVLTWILKDNLGGNSKTVMLATISPASAQFEETMSTLRYAERAKKIQNKAHVNESNDNEVVAALQREIENLKQQLRGAGDSATKARLADELAVSEAFEKDLARSLEQKLSESNELMKEREKHMVALEAELSRQKNVIENLQTINSEKDKKIASLLSQIAEREAGGERPSSNVNDEIERLRLQIAELEVQRDADEAKEKKRRQDAANARLRAEDLGNVKVEPAEGGKVSVRALAKAFEQHSTVADAAPVKKSVADLPQPKKLPHVLQQALAKQNTHADAPHVEEEENILDALEEDPAPAPAASAAAHVDPNDDIALDDDDDIQLDDEPAANDDDDIQLDDEEPAAAAAQQQDDDIALDDDDDDVKLDDDDDVAVDEPAGDEEIEIDDEPAAAAPQQTQAQPAVTLDDVHGDAAVSESQPRHDGGATSADIDQPVSEPKGEAAATAANRARACTVTAKKATAVAPTVNQPGVATTIAVPSHSLPNNRFLREPFKVIKIDEGALIGGKKERIWDVDFFGKKFANLDMSGYESFSQPAQNLFRVERDVNNSKKLTIFFFDAPHPYDLEFTSTERRQRFYELAMLQRRNSIMWCPSLCPEGENDVTLNVQGTTIDRPNGKVVKAKGDVKFNIARMPYEVIDMYYGAFSLQEKPLPKSAAVLQSFLPKTLHEIYVIGVTDVPKELMGNDEIANYLLSHLGPTVYFVLANSAVEGKVRNSNNVVVILVRRSFIVRVSHIEAAEVLPVRKDGVSKTDFSGIGCAMRINECSVGILLINSNPAVTDPALRAGCVRGLMSNFPFGNTKIDIGARFDYFLVSGNFGFRGDFTDNDMLRKQIRAGNIMSDFIEAEPHTSLASTTNPLRVFASVKPRVCRLDIKQYQTSRAMSMPNVFITADIFCQRAFLSTFGEQVPRTQFIFTQLAVQGHRIPHINSPDLQFSAEWIESSPIAVPLTKQGDIYQATPKAMPPLVPVVCNFDFLRLQTISFTVLGVLPAAKDKTKVVIASAALPLKNSFSLGETVDFSVPLYYRGCNVGFLSGTILQVTTEKNDAEMQSAGVHPNERDAHVVTCYENQVLDAQGTWAAAMYPESGAWDWSACKDPALQARRESFTLPDPDKWKWLTQWRHEARADNVDGWMFAENFKSSFEIRKSKTHQVRRRRWTRVMQAEDALVLHNFLEQLQKEGGQAH